MATGGDTKAGAEGGGEGGGDPAGRLEAVVLAGGFGARFGGGKLSAAWRGGALIDGALAAAFAAPARAVTVVTGADPAVADAARAVAAARGEARRLRLVHAADHAEGMAATLRAGIAALPADAAGAFVFLGDMPRIPAAVLPALAAAVTAGAPAAAPTWAGQRGHPVLFAAALFPGLLALTGDEGARTVLRALGPALALVEAPDDGVLFDVDTPGQLAGG
ncbi:nucleotidyltransferase family protein [Caulobacter sp. KR2-114]|uniref:nucleotidyltransferase family protein n=1 Tax=Caulobacter sp. KR2-114 TaxID=3400912 RepID=UPI003C068728